MRLKYDQKPVIIYVTSLSGHPLCRTRCHDELVRVEDVRVIGNNDF